MKSKWIKERAITLISLVITIIILLILVGVGINLSLGENGLFGRAKEAKNKYLTSAEEEQQELNELHKQLGTENLPENTKDTKAGTEVKPLKGWYSTTPAYISTEDGSIVKKVAKVINVIAVATGNGETVPVPKGFYYVGGKISTGVVISDNPSDQNKYAGMEDVPAGVEYNTDGTVNAQTSQLKGNQFVWIPCKEEEYTKKTWGKNGKGQDSWNANWGTTTNGTELPQIQKYGGFYVGRYEAGTSNITLSSGMNFANTSTANSWMNDSFSIKNNTVTGKITTKAGEIPYYHADYETALELSNSMYKTEYVQSTLITGTMWDTMLKFIIKINDTTSDETIVTKSNWGNYYNGGNVTYTAGKGRYALVNVNNGVIYSNDSTTNVAFVPNNGNCGAGIKTTAISEDVKKKNLYDVAGNLWEWTQEAAYPYNTNVSYMARGGSFASDVDINPTCWRDGVYANNTMTCLGFRPALFIK